MSMGLILSGDTRNELRVCCERWRRLYGFMRGAFSALQKTQSIKKQTLRRPSKVQLSIDRGESVVANPP